jgi:hypothetical protein
VEICSGCPEFNHGTCLSRQAIYQSIQSNERKNDTKVKREVSVLVRTNQFSCKKIQHQIKDVFINIPVLNRFGKVLTYRVKGAHCPLCNTFFISTDNFEMLKNHGSIFCKVMDEKMYRSKSYSYASRLQPESELHMHGYTVNSHDDLSDIQRHRILDMVIDSKTMTQYEIHSHISWLIHSNAQKANFNSALRKWKDDLKYVDQHQMQADIYSAGLISYITYV